MLAMQFADAEPVQLTAQVRLALVDLLTSARQAVNDDPEAAHRCLDRVTSILRPLVAVDAPGAGEYAVGGLAPWQLRLLQTYVRDRLSERITTPGLAAAVRLSTSHFTRAFKLSVGCTPHSFVLRQRIERAKELMLGTTEPLSQIALACGLADQAHFTRTFRIFESCSPAAWRRINRQPAGLSEPAFPAIFAAS